MNYDAEFEKLLKEAAQIAAYELGAEMKKPKEAVSFSEKHMKKMEDIFKRERRRERILRLSKFSKIAACVIVAVGIISSAAWFGVTAWKRSSLEYSFDPEKEGTQISFSDGDAADYMSERIYLGYLPGGFVCTDTCIDEEKETARFEKDGLYVEFIVYFKEDIDLKSENEKSIKINKNKGVAVKNGKEDIILWKDDEFSFMVKGNISERELKKVAENVEYYGGEKK